MKPLPHAVPGPDNDLNEKIDAYVSRAVQDELATVYAFGERWGPEPNKNWGSAIEDAPPSMSTKKKSR